MNSRITVDLHENILLETDNYPSADELIALVCEQPFLIDLTVQQILPQIKKYAEDYFGCTLDLKTLCTIEGHTPIEVKIKHFMGDDTASLVLLILKDDKLVMLMQSTVRILAALLPLPYSICKRCKNKHKCKRCP